MVFAYFDTCIWLSAFFSKDTNHKKAVELFQQVEKGQYALLVTHHVLVEIFDVLKKQAAVATKNQQGTEKLTRQMYRKLSKTLLKLKNVRIKNPHVQTHDVFRPSFSLLYKYLGRIAVTNKCPICSSTFNFVSLDTIFEGDALHVLLAWNLNCDIFITFDKDFKQLEKEPSLSPMKIEVLSK